MGKIWNFVLEEIIDVLAVGYLRGRVNKSPHLRNYVDDQGNFELERFESHSSYREGWHVICEGERIFEKIYSDVKRERGPSDYAMVIDTKTGEHRFTKNVAEAEKAIPEMPNPNHCYIKPLSTPPLSEIMPNGFAPLL